jgi:hypothetical protein
LRLNFGLDLLVASVGEELILKSSILRFVGGEKTKE